MTQTICLNMIVKDEEHIIEQTLENLCQYIQFDYWVICDTGSTDNTKKIITDFFIEKNIKGELHGYAWKDFSTNRNQALEMAFNKTDYCLIFDADDCIKGDFKIPFPLTKDGYNLKFGEVDFYTRTALINNRKKWRYSGVLHECIGCCDVNNGYQTIEGEYYTISGKSGSRSKDPLKYIKDAAILEKAFNECPDGEGLKFRYAFYCAQSYKDGGDYKKAIEWYKTCTTLGGWSQEIYMSFLMIGDLYESEGKMEEAVYYWLQTYEYDKQRIEGIYKIITHFYHKKNYGLAMQFYNMIDNVADQKPYNETKLFIRKYVYEYDLPFFMTILAFNVNRKDIGIKMLKLLYKTSLKTPNGIFQNGIFNTQFFFDDVLNYDKIFFQDFLRFLNFHCINGGYSINDTNFPIFHNIQTRCQTVFGDCINPSTIKNLVCANDKRKTDIILTFTTCKRIDLFKKTVNSMLSNWIDIEKVDLFFCVDDNSSTEDREEMQTLFPFMKFYMKTENEKGHRKSMNIIWNKLKECNPDYWIHIEDDWLFVKRENYIERGIAALQKYENINQVLFNKNYGEIFEDVTMKGGEELEPGLLMHTHNETDIKGTNCSYWPHYSFRPSITQANTIIQLGDFNSPNTFFEMDYANKYTKAGYKSAFFNEITCLHIGKLAGQRGNKDQSNAYDLNNVDQFQDNKESNKDSIHIINLQRRHDRKTNMIKNLKEQNIETYTFVNAVDGQNIRLNQRIYTLFKDNDFGNRRSFIGCALSHYNLWTQLIEDDNSDNYIIIEDDISFCSGFKEKLSKIHHEIKQKDMVFLGYSMFEANRTDKHTSNETPSLHPLNNDIYIGGFFGYSINKQGALKAIAYIEKHGITSGIDFLVTKIHNLNKFECIPQLVFTLWNERGKTIDTDIQDDYAALDLNIELAEELFKFFPLLDSIGNDITHMSGNINQMLVAAQNNNECLAVNTLGFLKHTVNINNLTPSVHFGEDDGIYIKKSFINNFSSKNENSKKVIRIKMICDWCSSKQLCNEWSNMCQKTYFWENIEITWTNTDIDLFVIINKPSSDDEFYIPKKTIVFQMEPWVYDSDKHWGVKTWGKWAKPNEETFLHVFTHRNNLNNVQWQINVPKIENEHNERLNKVITIISSKNFDVGHKHRVQFIKYHDERNEHFIDVFGRENYHSFNSYISPLQNDKKELHFINYKYCLSVENNSEVNYATEKIWEPILCECLCFYWGCPNIADYIDERAFVQLDMNDFEKSYQIIKTAIEEDWWSQRINIIRKEKQKILTELGFFPTISKLITSLNSEAPLSI